MKVRRWYVAMQPSMAFNTQKGNESRIVYVLVIFTIFFSSLFSQKDMRKRVVLIKKFRPLPIALLLPRILACCITTSALPIPPISPKGVMQQASMRGSSNAMGSALIYFST